ncbi:ribose ABC transporter permease [Spiroplasma sp. DGKH1]|uniref:ABC transporter permease subunit n=1 Tax=Spiroplasma sp. DGKH1 TaxID=3050074 RepID=UPI0034C66F1D
MNQAIKNNSWLLTQKTRIFFRSNEFKTKMNYVKASICAIIAGAILSFIIIGANDANPLLFFKYVFSLAFQPLMLDQTLTYWAIYIVAGLSVAIGFKAGLFNIGAPGQMLLAGSMSLVLGLKNPHISQGGGVVSALIISILVGSCLAAIAGALKAYFNIHEVVTTIMLNWIVWYVMKWMFMNQSFGLWEASRNSTKDITQVTDNFNLALNGQNWIIPFIIAIILLALAIFVINYTVLGFRIKAVGKSRDASLYAGTNVKFYMIVSMAISGGLAGVLGMLYYMTQSTVLQFTTDALPTVGFDAIAVALVAFTNGLSILPIALLWAIIKTSVMSTTQLPAFQMSKQMGQLIFGIIIYMTAISALFIYLKPILWIRRWFNIYHNKDARSEYQKYRLKIKEYKKEIKNINKEYHVQLKALKAKGNKEEVLNYKEEVNSQLTNLVGRINNLKTEINFFIQKRYKDSFMEGRKAIRTSYNNAIFGSIAAAMDRYVQANTEYTLKKQQVAFAKRQYEQTVKELTGKAKHECYELLNNYKKDAYLQLTNLHSAYSELISRQTEEIKGLKESYYPIFDQIHHQYENDHVLLKQHEKETMAKLNSEVKALKVKHKQQLHDLKQQQKVAKQQIKAQLKELKLARDNDPVLKQQVATIKENLNLKLQELKKEHLANLEKLRIEQRNELPELRNKYNHEVSLIIQAVKDDNKLLRQELLRKKETYKKAKLVQKGGQ